MEKLIALLGLVAIFLWLPAAGYLHWACKFNVIGSLAAGFFGVMAVAAALGGLWYILDRRRRLRRAAAIRP